MSTLSTPSSRREVSRSLSMQARFTRFCDGSSITWCAPLVMSTTLSRVPRDLSHRPTIGSLLE